MSYHFPLILTDFGNYTFNTFDVPVPDND